MISSAVPRKGARALRRADTQGFLWLYLVVLTGAEIAVVLVSPLLVFPLHGGLAAVLAGLYAYLQTNSVQDERRRELSGLVLALTLAPLIRIISLTLPLASIEPAFRYMAAGVPMIVGAFLVARTLKLSPARIGLQWRDTPWQVGIFVVSIGFGFIEYLILRPSPLGPSALTFAGLLPALSVGLSAGFSEELLFRGVLQRALRPVTGRWTVLYASAIFAVLHVGYQSFVDLAFVFAVGLVFGLVFERTRSIIGVSAGHAIANITLYFIAPFVLILGAGTTLP